MDGNFDNEQTQASSSPKALLKFVGIFPADDLKEIAEAIARDCDHVEPLDQERL